MRQFVAFNVRSCPGGGIGGLGDERLQTILRAWVGPNIQLIEIQHRANTLDRLFGDGVFGMAELTQNGGGDETNEQTENDDDDEQLKQCKARFTFTTV